MEWNFKSILVVFSIAIIIVAIFYTSNVSFQKYEQQVFMEQDGIFLPSSGKLQITVIDGFTEKPIEGAQVVIPETGKSYTTYQEGLTPVIEVPILEDKHFQNILRKPWGEITVLVYKENYIEYALFHTHVLENQTRKGPKVLLFAKDSKGSNEPFSLIEGPHRLWVDELIQKYQPKQ